MVGEAAGVGLSPDDGGEAQDDLTLGPRRWWGGTGRERRCLRSDLTRRGRGGGGATGGDRRRGRSRRGPCGRRWEDEGCADGSRGSDEALGGGDDGAR
jgi:hypothetical protein